jgi:hypothetical protein
VEEIIRIVLNWAIPVILTGIFGFLVKLFKNMNTMKSSQLSLIRSQIVSKCEKYLEQGYLPEYARYCLNELFQQYKVLGGNHGIEVLVDKCLELPLSKKGGK